MELLLWMWFYDPRWFFNIKLSIRCYKYTWLIPLMAHMILVSYCIYLIVYSSALNDIGQGCDETVIPSALFRIFFSFLISLTIIIFIFKISFVFNRELKFFENAENIYPTLKTHMEPYNFWIRRKSLISMPGILLLFLSIISMFWSYLLIEIYIFGDKEKKITQCNLISFLNVNNLFIFIGNIPLIVLFLLMIILKIISLFSAFLCPNLLVGFSKITNYNNNTNNNNDNTVKKVINRRNNSISY